MNSTLFVLFSIFLLLLAPQILHASTDRNTDPKSYFYPADSKPFGKSYPEWAAAWWKFVLEYPEKDARLVDPDGRLCAVNQTGNVWVLPGTSSSNVERRCVIPAGVSLLVSPTDTYCNKDEAPHVGDNEEEMRKCAKADLDPDTYAKTILDGIELSNLHEVNRFQSVVFDLYYPPGEGPTKTVADGVFLMLKPLPEGEHELRLGAKAPSQNWAYNLTYHLTVK